MATKFSLAPVVENNYSDSLESRPSSTEKKQTFSNRNSDVKKIPIDNNHRVSVAISEQINQPITQSSLTTNSLDVTLPPLLKGESAKSISNSSKNLLNVNSFSAYDKNNSRNSSQNYLNNKGNHQDLQNLETKIQHLEEPPNYAKLFGEESFSCSAKKKKFSISSLGYGTLKNSNASNPDQLQSVNSHQINIQQQQLQQSGNFNNNNNSIIAWWVGNKLSNATRKENEQLDTLLKKLNSNYLKEKIDKRFVTEEFDSDMGEAGSGLKGVSIFDKNFNEIQKLLEKIKNLDDKNHQNIANLQLQQQQNLNDKKKGNEKSEQQENQVAMAAATAFLDGNGGAMGNILGRSNSGTGLMRKPLRLIYIELNKRIENLKNSQSEWDAFQNKITAYKLEDNCEKTKYVTDIIQSNKVFDAYYPSKKLQLLSINKQKHDDRIKTVLENHRLLKSEKVKKVLMQIKKKDLVNNEKMKEQPKEKLGKTQLLQKKWFIAITLASKLNAIRDFLILRHQEREISLLETHSAIIIQKAWKKYKAAIQYEKVKTSLAIISRVFHKYIIYRREEEKHKASNLIRQFFRDVHDVSKLMKIVKKYRFSVVKAQQISRAFLNARNMRTLCICKHWESLVPQWWNLRKPNAISDDTSKKKKDKNQKPGKEKEKVKVIVEVPEHIKLQVIKEDYVERRKAYRKAMREYEMLKHNKPIKINSGKPDDIPELVKPVFKVT
ncbi:hypothetical protein HK099_002957 [Clydaea vesicula]|uniref:Uncharacterized protein n=1 Tax=Clydaea vesicula TaxID=447962 RepID=A0AAD5U2H2_9FUNG|nr:hypothetical protein HK099_002957 [Clydaea vesicula]